MLHLTGVLEGGSKPFTADGAGIAEAVICVVLLAGAAALAGAPAWGRSAALAATAFAIVGFIVGLTFTVRGGKAVNIVCHGTMLPVLLITLILIVRAERNDGSARARTDAGRV